MKDFKSGGFGGNRGGDRKGGFGGGRDGGRPSFGSRDGQMYKATCAECGKSCEVPFKPNGQKPVYCNDCFGKNSGGNDGFVKKDRNDFSSGKKFDKPFTKSFDKPFAPRRDDRANTGGGNNNDMKQTLQAISTKLDRLIQIMDTKNIMPVTKAPEMKNVVPVVKSIKTIDKGALAKVVKKAVATKKVVKKVAVKKAKKK